MEGFLPLLGVILGVALTWVTSELNRRSARKDEWVTIRRAKLEETTAEMARVQHLSLQLAMNNVAEQQGMTPVSLPEQLNLTQLSALLSLYFPEAREVVQEHKLRQGAWQADVAESVKFAVQKDDQKRLDNIKLRTIVEANLEVGRYVKELQPILDKVATDLARP